MEGTEIRLVGKATRDVLLRVPHSFARRNVLLEVTQGLFLHLTEFD